MKPGAPEIISKSAPEWPFKDLKKNFRTKKVQIKENKPYFGTSTSDILEARY